jgi:Cohesin domain/Dockerin type I domain
MSIRERSLVSILFLLGGLLLVIVPVGAQGTAGFSANISAQSVQVGASVTTVIEVQTGGQAVDGAEIHLDFDPAILQVASVTPGTKLPVTITAPIFNNTAGTIDYAAGAFSNFPNTTFDLLTITLTAKTAGTGAIRIPASGLPRRTDITSVGKSLVNLTAPLELGSIIVSQPATPSLVPTVMPTTTAVPTATSVPAEPTVTSVPSGPTLYVHAKPANAGLAQPVTVDLELANTDRLYGLDARCTVNPAVLIGTQRTDGTVFNAANSFFVDAGFQTGGNWNVAVSLLNPAPAFAGSGTAFSLNYLVAGAGTTPIICEAMAVDVNGASLPLTVINGEFVGEAAPQPTATLLPSVTPVTPPPTLEPTTTLTPTIEPTVEPTFTPTPTAIPQTGSAQGVVQLQARSDHAGITLTLLLGGTTGVGQTITGPDGAFRFDNLVPGSYALQILTDGHLAAITSFEVPAEGLTLPLITLPAGDTNTDQFIDLTDAALVGANFLLSAPPAPVAADVNRDGVVNISDLALIGGNFGLVGPLNK